VIARPYDTTGTLHGAVQRHLRIVHRSEIDTLGYLLDADGVKSPPRTTPTRL
jgi:hypothetical protein